MRLLQLIPALVLSSTAGALVGRRSLRHVGLQDRPLPRLDSNSFYEYIGQNNAKRADSKPLFLNSNTSSYAVNGTGIPDVDFDVGESYSGYLPISSDPKDENKLFWWFFPSTNPDASKEILIWLNGGPGCSSFEGLIQENGPFLWQYGTLKPVPNPWAWNKLTNVVWVEQPIGTGFSTGKVTAVDENDVAKQFMGFWKNFIDLFGMQGYKVYIAGESYAGMYCPYIASNMLDAKDSTYYNVSGMLIYDPSIAVPRLQSSVTTVPFVNYWGGLFPFNDSFVSSINKRHQDCGYADYLNKYLVYPPPGPQPVEVPGQGKDGCDIFDDVVTASLAVNPCWDIYQVSATCPLLWDILGFPGTIPYLPDGGKIYFDRTDVKKAIHAPTDHKWAECTDNNVFVEKDGLNDTSLPSALTVLPGVIERTQNVMIAHGALDMVLIANGTLLAIQNMTWGGKLGFQAAPSDAFYVPYHDDVALSTLAGAGVMGTTHTERGLTYVGVDLSGHMVPQYQPTAAFRQLEVLLGRAPGLSSTVAFSTNRNVTQVDAKDLGKGNAPQPYASANGSNGTATGQKPGGNGAAASVLPVVTGGWLACLVGLVAALGVLM